MARVLPGPATAGVEAELAELLRRCAGRDRAALSELAERHGPRLRAILARTLKEPALAEAALAPALDDLWETAPYFHPGRISAEDWVFGRVRRRAREILSTGLPAAPAAPDVGREGASGSARQPAPPPTEDADPPRRELVGGPSGRASLSGRVKVTPPAQGAAAGDHDRGGGDVPPVPPRPVHVLPVTRSSVAPRGRAAVADDPDVEPPPALTRRRGAPTAGRGRHRLVRLGVAAAALVVLVAGGFAAVGLLPPGSGIGPEPVPNVGGGPEAVAESPVALPPPVWVPPFARPADEGPSETPPPALSARDADAPNAGPAPSGTRADTPSPATPDAAPRRAAEPRSAAPTPPPATAGAPGTPVTASAGGAAVRVFIHFTASTPQAETAARRLADDLRDEGFAVAGLRAVPFRINAGSVRYFSEADREGARRLLGASRGFLGPAARGPVDLTHYQPKPSPGTVEVWLPTS